MSYLRFTNYKTAGGCKAGWTKAQLLPEGISADGAALSQFTIYDVGIRALCAGRLTARNF